LVLASASSAQAATVTLGQRFTPTSNCDGGTGLTELITGESAGTYPVPAPGVITSWSFQDAGSVVNGLKLKVARHAGGKSYTIIGEATAGTQMTNAVNNFATSIPVHTGDVIGFSFAGPTK
jgi:hypothetical protein